jgi:hypothetical protein
VSEADANEYQQFSAPEHHDVEPLSAPDDSQVSQDDADAYQQLSGPEQDADQLTGPEDRQPVESTQLTSSEEPPEGQSTAEPDTAGDEVDRSVPTTGDARVDDALGRLGDLTGLPVAEHLPVYEDVQRRLHDALADLDER